MAGRRRRTPSVYIIGFTRELWSRPPLLATLLLAALLLAPSPFSGVARADHLMCGWSVEQRTQTVWVDPDLAGRGVTRADVIAAFEPWNLLFSRYHGMPVFAEHLGSAETADIVVTARGSERTWVQTKCTPGFVQRGATHSFVFLGWRDAWRNRGMLSHELGHALGLADHGSSAQHSHGHVGFKACNNTYIGVMSYCTSSQAWFLDYVAPGISFDGGLVQRYW